MTPNTIHINPIYIYIYFSLSLSSCLHSSPYCIYVSNLIHFYHTLSLSIFMKESGDGGTQRTNMKKTQSYPIILYISYSIFHPPRNRLRSFVRTGRWKYTPQTKHLMGCIAISMSTASESLLLVGKR